jgi:hypothetical protein
MVEEDKGNSHTSTLIRDLFNSPTFTNFLEKNPIEFEMPKFHEYISALCNYSGSIPEKVILQSAIERTYGHQLFNGTRKPSRDKIIQLAFGLKLSVDETQKLLQIGKKSPLYPKIKRDAAILYCIINHKDVYETQGMLEALGLTLLGVHSHD